MALAGLVHRTDELVELCRSSEEDDEKEDELDPAVGGVMARGALAAPLDATWETALEASHISVGQS